MLNIIKHPNEILRQKALPVANVLIPEIQKLIPEMIETMVKSDGVGLAAPQIGQSIRLVVIRHRDSDLVIFNPEILKKSLLKEWGEEGCLSVPFTFGQVKRHKNVTLQYIDQNGKTTKIVARGLLARVIQHEVDHLNGVLFIDKAKKIEVIEPAN